MTADPGGTAISSDRAPAREARPAAGTDTDAAMARLPAEARPLAQATLASLEDDKAEDIVLIDLGTRSSIADAMVVATGRSSRQVAAMADHLVERLAPHASRRIDVEGLPQADWVLIDAGDVIVHLFRPEVRSFYQLEKMWSAEEPGVDPASLRPSTAQAHAPG